MVVAVVTGSATARSELRHRSDFEIDIHTYCDRDRRAVVFPVAAGALAGPGFIAETQVTRGGVYAEVSIRFRCGVQYLGHDQQPTATCFA